MLKHNHIIIRAEVEKPPKDIRFARKWIRKFIKAMYEKSIFNFYEVQEHINSYYKNPSRALSRLGV